MSKIPMGENTFLDEYVLANENANEGMPRDKYTPIIEYICS